MSEPIRRIWILNHYASMTGYSTGFRHYYFARRLIQAGYQVTIVAASTVYNSDENLITDGRGFLETDMDGIHYIYIRARNYTGNGFKRIQNMLDYCRRLWGNAGRFDRPDLVMASSPHLFTLVTGVLLAGKYRCPSVSEVRDLWPESIYSFGAVGSKLPLLPLYWAEKWAYKKSDRLIFTMEGGPDYIREKRWDTANGGRIDLNKARYINNGIDLAKFDDEKSRHTFTDEDLDNPDTFKVIYSGSIKKAQKVRMLVEAAELLAAEKNLVFLIFGEGEEKQELVQYCESRKLANVKFKGSFAVQYVPYILSKGDLNLLNYQQASIWKYGGSQNKLFEYLASARPVLANFHTGYSILEQYGCGISKDVASARDYADAVLSVRNLPRADYDRMCAGARNAAQDFDYSILSDKFLSVVTELLP